MITINDIKSLMQPVQNPAYAHSALLDSTEGIHAVNLALLRWCGGAKQVTLTQWELKPDAVGRILTLDVFIGQFVGVRYADWAKGVHRNKRGNNSLHNNVKGKYLTAPHITLDCLQGKRIHYRPFVHTLVAYTYPPLREQYAQAVLDDMQAHNRTFNDACVQVNHMDKNTHNNSAANLEGITASANSLHKALTTIGNTYSMLLHKGDLTGCPELREYINVLSDLPSYVERMCLQISNANLPSNTGKITVGVKSITENKTKTVDISDLTIWGILTALYTAKAHHICVEELYDIAN